MDACAIPHLIVMLTYNDYTVENAEEVFENAKNAAAHFWGMKEKPLSKERMKSLFARMSECGKKTALEVVGYEKEDALRAIELADECGCNILMGTRFFSEVADFCKARGILYFPFVGELSGRPSLLKGPIEDIVAEAHEDICRGASGIDLLGYRYCGDASMLIHRAVKEIDAPVCVAGSIDSYKRLDEVLAIAPWAFTIGSAFFDNKFEGTFAEQINKVCSYLESKN